MQNTAAVLRRGTSALPAVPYVHHALRLRGQRAFLLYLPAQRRLGCPAGYEKRGDCWAAETVRCLAAAVLTAPFLALFAPVREAAARALEHPLPDS